MQAGRPPLSRGREGRNDATIVRIADRHGHRRQERILRFSVSFRRLATQRVGVEPQESLTRACTANLQDEGGRAAPTANDRGTASARCLLSTPGARLLTVVEAEPLTEPVGEPSLVHLVRRDGQHGRFSFVHVRWVWIPTAAVELHEHDQARPCGSFVPIWQWMVPGKVGRENRSLVDQFRVEVVVAETSLGACRAESARSTLAIFVRTAVSMPVTCPASQKYSARLR
jgi:hypothetical protein